MPDQPWDTDETGAPGFPVDVTFTHRGDQVRVERAGYPTYDIDQATLIGAIIKVVGARQVYDAIHAMKSSG